MIGIQDRWTSPDPADRSKRVRNAKWGRGLRWQARWTDPAGRERYQSCRTKDEAQAVLDREVTARLTGTATDPAKARRTVGHYITVWLDVAGEKPSAKSWNRGAAKSHLRPRWDAVRVADVTTTDVKQWGAELARTPNGRGGMLSASRRRGLLFALAAILDLAVQDRALTVNPVRGVPLPKVRVKRGNAPETAKVHALFGALRERYPGAELAAMVQAYTGCRWAELVALDVADHQRKPTPRLRIDDSIPEVDGRLEPGATKSHAEREAPLPAFLDAALVEWVGSRRWGPLIPGPRGGRYRRSTWRRHWTAALAEVGLDGDLTPHGLRHVAASWAIASGADVKVVQSMLGHASAALTLDVYGHLLADRLPEVASAMGAFAPRAQHVQGGAPEGGGTVAELRRQA